MERKRAWQPRARDEQASQLTLLLLEKYAQTNSHFLLENYAHAGPGDRTPAMINLQFFTVGKFSTKTAKIKPHIRYVLRFSESELLRFSLRFHININ